MRNLIDGIYDRCKHILKSHISIALTLAVILSVTTSAISLHANSVTINNSGSVTKVFTLSKDSSEILKEAKVVTKQNDKITFSGIKNGVGIITITHYYNVSITADGQTKNYLMPSSSVKDALSLASITLGTNDELNLPLGNTIASDLAIKIDRVEYKIVQKSEEIAYNIAVTYSNSLYIGQTKNTDGKNGQKTYTYQYKIVNGKVINTTLLSVKTTQTPISGAKTIGTKSKQAAAYTNSTAIKCVSTLIPSSPIALTVNGVPVSYKKVITGRATAYTAYGNSKTSTGKTPQPGYIAVDPKKIPYGSKLYIKTPDGKVIYGYAVAADTGGFTKKGKLIADLYFKTKAECINFGVQTIEIYVLT